MKKILVPTDFSEHANNALRYAINIANYFEAEVNLLHVYELRTTNEGIKIIREYAKEEAERDLADNMRAYQKLVFGKTILTGKAIEGTMIDSVCSIADHEKVDLIVMGTQGASGLKEIFLGSKTSGVMQRSHVPILAIPNHFIYRPIKHILFPVDSGIVADGEVLKPMLEIAKSYKSNIQVLHLETKKIVVGYDPGIEFYLDGIPHTFHTVSGAKDVNSVVNTFATEDKSDLLCMVRRERGFWGNIFHKSVTTKEIMNSPVPLLVLRSES